MIRRSAAFLAILGALALAAPAALAADSDSGFRPGKDGFSFPNYGEGQPNMGPAQMRKLFGDAVCGSQPASDTCALTPPAKEWMDRSNGQMNGGHCMGFSVVALRFFAGAESPDPFGASTTFGLTLQEPIAREIAYAFMYQFLDRVQQAKIEGTPKQILAALQRDLPEKQETFTIAIFKPGFKDGHAITPYAVKNKGDGKFGVQVYDNNFPNEEREVVIDTRADTFEYNTATNPSEAVDLYRGDASTHTLWLYPTTPGQGVQACPFCAAVSAHGAAGTAGHSRSVQVGSTGGLKRHASLRISDGDHAVGSQGGHFVNTFRSGADAINLLDFRNKGTRREPFYRVPAGRAYTITVKNRDRRKLKGDGVRITGPNYEATVHGLQLAGRQIVTIRVSADGSKLTFTSNRSLDASTISIGRTEIGADHDFVLQRKSLLPRGQKLVFVMNPRANRLRIGGANGTYDLFARRVDDSGEQVFVRQNFDTSAVNSGGGEETTLEYGGWDGTPGSGIAVEGQGGEKEEIQSEVPPDTNPDQAQGEVTGEPTPGADDGG